MLKTRKDLNDKDGQRTVYVIETKFPTGWIASWSGNASFRDRKDAVRRKKEIFEEVHDLLPHFWKKKMFRIAVYVRAEE